MEGLLRELYTRYNDLPGANYIIQNASTALRILQEDINNIKTLDERIRMYDIKATQLKLMEKDVETISFYDLEQPASIFLKLTYLEIILRSFDDAYFDRIGIERKKIYQITLSICLYLIFLQIYHCYELELSKPARNRLIIREDYYIGLDELRAVCWDISQEDYNRFISLYAYDIDSEGLIGSEDMKLYCKDNLLFVLAIDSFINYMIYRVEALYKESTNRINMESYFRNKGFLFEDVVYGLIANHTNEIAHTVFYYQPNKKTEVDIVVKDDNSLLIIECKSGTIDIQKKIDIKALTKIVRNKVRKAYKSLDAAYTYVSSNDTYCFRNDNISISGSSQETTIHCLHISMYSMDAISSNIHTLDDIYIKESNIPKITMSLEHFLAIFMDCQKRDFPFSEYLSKREELISTFSSAKFDNNELDLYHQLTNNGMKSMLSESLEMDFLKNFSEDVQIVSSFHDIEGNEYRPARDLLKAVDDAFMAGILDSNGMNTGINKRYIRDLRRYLAIEENPERII